MKVSILYTKCFNLSLLRIFIWNICEYTFSQPFFQINKRYSDFRSYYLLMPKSYPLYLKHPYFNLSIILGPNCLFRMPLNCQILPIQSAHLLFRPFVSNQVFFRRNLLQTFKRIQFRINLVKVAQQFFYVSPDHLFYLLAGFILRRFT